MKLFEISSFRLLSLTAAVAIAGSSTLGAATLVSTGAVDDLAAKISAAADGDVITIPAGSYAWTSGISVKKAIRIQGAGAGRILARSASSVTVGTGTKTFGLITESVRSMENLKSGLVIGSVVKCAETCNEANYVQGVVTAVSSTSMTLDVTQTGGSGTPSLWVISTPSATVITHNAGTANLIQSSESTAGSIEIAGIRFVGGNGTGAVICHSAMLNGKPLLLHDCYFETSSASASGIFVRISSNRGLIYSCSFSAAGGFVQSNVVCIQHKDASDIDASAAGSWTRPSTMGAADTSGTSNLYVEDCDLHGFAEGVDADDNSRIVVRDCLLDNSGMGTHGADTSTYGVRHYEFYNNEFAFANRGALTFNLSHWLYFRGGTGVITDNVIPDISSMQWGNKPEIRIQVQNLSRSAGPHPLWGANITGAQYPAPRQFGMGRVTGTSSSDSYTYNGDSEPLYQWNNTGGGQYAAPSYENYSSPVPTGCDDISGYVQTGRDYMNASKPGYAKYAYPHPLRSTASLQPNIATLPAPTNARVSL